MKPTLLATLFIFFICSFATAQDRLACDYPEQWEEIGGYTLYFNESGDTDQEYVKNILKTDVTIEGEEGEEKVILCDDIVADLNLSYNINYTFELTAYNELGESTRSNTVTYVLEGYQPPDDYLPAEQNISPATKPTGLNTI